MSCSKLESTKLPENLTSIGVGSFALAFTSDKINSNTIDIYIPSTIRKLDKESFAGYSLDSGGNKKIDKIYFGSNEIDLVKNIPDNITINSETFVNSTINQVIIYCSSEDYGLWNSPATMSKFPSGVQFIFPCQ